MSHRRSCVRDGGCDRTGRSDPSFGYRPSVEEVLSDGAPTSKARFARGSSRVDAGACFGSMTRGDDSALVRCSVKHDDLRLRLIPINASQMRRDIENILGTVVMDSRLAASFVSRLRTSTLGSAAESARR